MDDLNLSFDISEWDTTVNGQMLDALGKAVAINLGEEALGVNMPPSCPPTSVSMPSPSHKCDTCSLEFNKLSGLQKHWDMLHCPQVLLYKCLIEGCKHRYPYHKNVLQHISSKHARAFLNEEERVAKCKSLPQTIETNTRYISPTSLPPHGITINQPLIAHHYPARYGCIPDIDQQRQAKLSLACLDKVLPSNNKDLQEQYFYLSHYQNRIARRLGKIKEAFKKREEEESRRKDRKIKELEDELKKFRELSLDSNNNLS